MILEVEPDLPDDFRIPEDATRVQFWKRLSERDFEILARAMESRPDVTLRAFHLIGTEYTDLDFLAHFPHVRRLAIDLYWVKNIEGLQAIRELDELSLGWTDIKSFSLRFLERFKTLRRLYVEGHKKDIAVIAGLAVLERLTLRSITLPDLNVLTLLPALRHLEIKLGGTSNLSALRHLSQLEYLELWLIRGLSDLSVIAEIASLRFLFLQALSRVKSLPSFRTLPNLRAVYLQTMKGLTDLRPVSEAPAIEDVTLIDMPTINVESLRCFVGHPTLRAFCAGLGRVKLNAEAKALIGLPRGPGWRWVTSA